MHGTTIEWCDEGKGICQCPNAASHSSSTRTECVIWIDGNFDRNASDQWPTKKCSHNHCQDHPLIKQFNHELRSRIGRAERREDTSTPNAYLKSRYPELADAYGDPIRCDWITKRESPAICIPVALNERFFAALLVREGNPNDPGVFDLDENKWLRYCPEGFYKQTKAEAFHEPVGQLLLDVARKCKAPNVDTKPLQFNLRSTRVITPIVTKASGVACVDSSRWHWPSMMLPVANGVLDLKDHRLLPHSPDYYFRGVIGVPYIPGATCPRWDKLLEEQVHCEDADLINRLAGLAIYGSNVAQVMSLLIGAPASSKGTIVRVITGLVGVSNVGTLRTTQLDGRFEVGRHRHKLLLYGPDVDEDFLTNQGASLLKAITGQDLFSPEFKNSNAVPPAEPLRASVMMTANSRLRIRFQGDKDAYRRRFVVILFEKEIPEAERIPDYADRLLQNEGPGILNWALEGLKALVHDGCKIVLTERQRQIRDKLLDESESSVAFAREALLKDPRGRLRASVTYPAYVEFCAARRWAPLTPHRFEVELKRAIVDQYGITQSQDFHTLTGAARGWRGVRLKEEEPYDELG